jgi:hypothetical protein
MLRWCIPLAFLALVAWLVVREIDSLMVSKAAVQSS